MPPAKKVSPEKSALEWLEEGLLEARTRLQRLERHFEEAVYQVQAHGQGLAKVEEGIASLGASVSAVSSLQEGQRQIKDQLSRLQDRQTALYSRLEEFTRQRQAELERERHDRSGLAKRVDGVETAAGRYENRLQAMEESAHHLEDELSSLRQGQQRLEEGLQELVTKADRGLEALLRLEQEAGRLANEMEALHQADEALVERASLGQEVTRRLHERVDALERQMSLLEQVRQEQESSRFQREKLAERLVIAEQGLQGAREGAGQMGHHLAVLQERTQQLSGQLLALIEEMREHRQEVTEQIKRFLVAEERQKRRQVEALQQELKELKQSEPHSPGQP